MSSSEEEDFIMSSSDTDSMNSVSKASSDWVVNLISEQITSGYEPKVATTAKDDTFEVDGVLLMMKTTDGRAILKALSKIEPRYRGGKDFSTFRDRFFTAAAKEGREYYLAAHNMEPYKDLKYDFIKKQLIVEQDDKINNFDMVKDEATVEDAKKAEVDPDVSVDEYQSMTFWAWTYLESKIAKDTWETKYKVRFQEQRVNMLDGFHAFRVIKALHYSKHPINATSALKQIASIKFDGRHVHLDRFLKEFTQLSDTLAEIGFPLHDKQKLLYLLSALPSTVKFDVFKQQVTSRRPIPETSDVIDDLRELLAAEDTEPERKYPAANKGKRPGSFAYQARSTAAEWRCWNCNEAGHLADNCPNPCRTCGQVHRGVSYKNCPSKAQKASAAKSGRKKRVQPRRGKAMTAKPRKQPSRRSLVGPTWALATKTVPAMGKDNSQAAVSCQNKYACLQHCGTHSAQSCTIVEVDSDDNTVIQDVSLPVKVNKNKRQLGRETIDLTWSSDESDYDKHWPPLRSEVTFGETEVREFVKDSDGKRLRKVRDRSPTPARAFIKSSKRRQVLKNTEARPPACCEATGNNAFVRGTCRKHRDMVFSTQLTPMMMIDAGDFEEHQSYPEQDPSSCESDYSNNSRASENHECNEVSSKVIPKLWKALSKACKGRAKHTKGQSESNVDQLQEMDLLTKMLRLVLSTSREPGTLAESATENNGSASVYKGKTNKGSGSQYPVLVVPNSRPSSSKSEKAFMLRKGTTWSQVASGMKSSQSGRTSGKDPCCELDNHPSSHAERKGMLNSIKRGRKIPFYKKAKTALFDKNYIKIDSGATEHYFSAKQIRKRNLKGQIKVKRDDNSTTKVVQTAGGQHHEILGTIDLGRFKDIRVVKGIATNMVSVGKLCDDGFEVLFTKKRVIIGRDFKGQQTELIGDRGKDGLYNLRPFWFGKGEKVFLTDTVPKNSVMLWHTRLGHVSPETIIKGVENKKICGLKLPKKCLEAHKNEVHECITCAATKATRRATKGNNKAKSKAQRPYQYLAIDICGPVVPQGYDGSHYFLVIYDIYSGAIWSLPIRRKSEASKAFAKWHEELRQRPNIPVYAVERMRSDNALELYQGDMKKYLVKNKIKMETTAPYSSYQNSYAERSIRTIVTMSRSMLYYAKAPKHYWSAAITYASLVHAHLPSRSNPEGKTPMQMIAGTDEPTSVHYLRTFFCPVFALDKEPKRNMKSRRFQPRGNFGWFLGLHGDNTNAYVILFKNGGQEIMAARDVYFMENIQQGSRLMKGKDTDGPVHAINAELRQLQVQSTETDGEGIGEMVIWQGPSRKEYKSLERGSSDESESSDTELDDVDDLLPMQGKLSLRLDQEKEQKEKELNSENITEMRAVQESDSSDSEQEPDNMFLNDDAESSNRDDGGEETSEDDFVPLRRSGRNKLPRIPFNAGASQEQIMKEVHEEKQEKNADSLKVLMVRALADAVEKGKIQSHLKKVDNASKAADHSGSQEVTAENNNHPDEEVKRVVSMYTPLTYSQAVNCPDKEQWLKAIKLEYDNLIQHNVWKVVPIPENEKIHLCKTKFVFKIKTRKDGSIDKYKARLVVKGFTQKEGVDFFETFSPTVKAVSWKIMLSLAAKHDFMLTQFDVKGAFLCAYLEDEVALYIEIPPGLPKDQVPKEGHVLKLVKGVYGTKQASRCWYEMLSKTLTKEMGFEMSPKDGCLFYKLYPNQGVCIICIYVDDGGMACSSKDIADEVIMQLEKYFELSDVGKLDWYLGMRLERNEKTGDISVDSEKYIDDILEKFKMGNDIKVMTNPCTPKKWLLKQDTSVQEDPLLGSEVPYRPLVGSLLYLSNTTRPDIAFAVNQCARQVSNPRQSHWTAAKRILRYLAGQKKKGLLFKRNAVDQSPSTEMATHTGASNGNGILFFCDSDWAGDKDTRRSMTGYIGYLHGNIITWKCTLQKVVALSSAEAELMAACEATKEINYVRILIEEMFKYLGFISNSVGKSTLLIDNSACIQISRNPVNHGRTKHIDIRYHYLRENVQFNKLTTEYVTSQDNVADILTKPLDTTTFINLRDKILDDGFRSGKSNRALILHYDGKMLMMTRRKRQYDLELEVNLDLMEKRDRLVQEIKKDEEKFENHVEKKRDKLIKSHNERISRELQKQQKIMSFALDQFENEVVLSRQKFQKSLGNRRKEISILESQIAEKTSSLLTLRRVLKQNVVDPGSGGDEDKNSNHSDVTEAVSSDLKTEMADEDNQLDECDNHATRDIPVDKKISSDHKMDECVEKDELTYEEFLGDESTPEEYNPHFIGRDSSGLAHYCHSDFDDKHSDSCDVRMRSYDEKVISHRPDDAQLDGYICDLCDHLHHIDEYCPYKFQAWINWYVLFNDTMMDGFKSIHNHRNVARAIFLGDQVMGRFWALSHTNRKPHLADSPFNKELFKKGPPLRRSTRDRIAKKMYSPPQ